LKHYPGLTHPVCAFKGGFAAFFLMAQPPLLSEEGNTLSPIHSHLLSAGMVFPVSIAIGYAMGY
jgi:hypothetical protein